VRVLEHLVAHRRRGAEPGRRDRDDVHEEHVGARGGRAGDRCASARALRDARGRRARERSVRRVDEGDEVALVVKEAAQVGAHLLGQDDALRLLAARQLLLDGGVLLLLGEVGLVLGVAVDVHGVVLGVRVVAELGAVGSPAACGLEALLGEDLGPLEAHGRVRAALLGDERELEDLGVALLAVAVGETARRRTSFVSSRPCEREPGSEKGEEDARSAVLAATLCAQALEELVDGLAAHVEHGAALLVLVAALVLEADLLALVRGADAVRDELVEAAAEVVVRLLERLAGVVVLDVVGVDGGGARLGVGPGLGLGDGDGALEGRVELEGGRDEAVLEEGEACDLLGELQRVSRVSLGRHKGQGREEGTDLSVGQEEAVAVDAAAAQELEGLDHVERVEDGRGKLDVAEVTRAVERGEVTGRAAARRVRGTRGQCRLENCRCCAACPCP